MESPYHEAPLMNRIVEDLRLDLPCRKSVSFVKRISINVPGSCHC